jgi:hypothetical protein
MNDILKIGLFAGGAYLAYLWLSKNSSLLSPATTPVATTITGAVPGVSGNIQENTGGIPTDALIPGAIYVMDCSSGRFGNVYASASAISATETRQLYIYNSGAVQMQVYRAGTMCPTGTLGEGY